MRRAPAWRTGPKRRRPCVAEADRSCSGRIPSASTALIPTGCCSTAPLAPTPCGVGCAVARADASAAGSPGAMSIPGQPVGTASDDASCIRAAVYRPPANRLPPIPPAVSEAVAASPIAGMPSSERRLFGILMYGTPSGVSAMKKYASALMTSLAAAAPTTGRRGRGRRRGRRSRRLDRFNCVRDRLDHRGFLGWWIAGGRIHLVVGRRIHFTTGQRIHFGIGQRRRIDVRCLRVRRGLRCVRDDGLRLTRLLAGGRRA